MARYSCLSESGRDSVQDDAAFVAPCPSAECDCADCVAYLTGSDEVVPLCIYCSEAPAVDGSDYCADPSCAINASADR